MWYPLFEQQRQWLRMWRAATRSACDAWPATTLPNAASSCFADLFEPLLGLTAGAPPFAIRSVALDGHCSDVEGCDHYGLFTGETWRDKVHPVLQAVFDQAEAGGPRPHVLRRQFRATAG